MLEFNPPAVYTLGCYPYPCIYKLVFGEDFYIGRAINLDQRIKTHAANLRSGKGSVKLQKAYDMNNENFTVEIVETVSPEQDMIYMANREEYYIKTLKPTLNGDHGSTGASWGDRERAEKARDSWGAKYLKPIREDLLNMGNAAAVKRYQEKLDEFKIRPYKEEGPKIRQFAANKGISVQELFLTAVREYMEKE